MKSNLLLKYIVKIYVITFCVDYFDTFTRVFILDIIKLVLIVTSKKA